MPIPEQRDLEVARTQLTGWLGAHLPGASGLRLSEITGPGFTGFSNETLMFGATWREGSIERAQGFVVRVKPTGYTLFLEAEFENQYRVIDALGRGTDVPVPPVHWFEEDPSALGAPFFVMDRVAGEIPSDNPPYTMGGWLADSTAADQERLWWSGVETLTRVHAVDWKGLGLEFLDRPERGADPLAQQIDYYADYLAWAEEGGPLPVARAALEWVRENRPPVDGAPCLLWGDARIGNMIFRDFACRAVLDWEMVTLGDPAEDLGWWLFLDRHHSEGLDLPRLPGIPSSEDTVRRYQELTGRHVDHLEFYEVFAGFRFSVIMGRLGRILMEWELLPPDADLPVNNIPSQLTAKMLGLPSPGPPLSGLGG